MRKDRLAAFSDGVIAIIITIMVLELKLPQDGGINALFAVAPSFVSYVLSFVYLAIYWNNHHHMLSPVAYIAGIVFAFFQPWVSIALYVGVAAMWLVPDRRIERVMHGK